jgi:hypothetical protein
MKMICKGDIVTYDGREWRVRKVENSDLYLVDSADNYVVVSEDQVTAVYY